MQLTCQKEVKQLNSLVISSLFIIFLSVFLYLAEKKNVFGKWKECYKQLLIGILFGIAAVVATNCGSDIGGAVINVRDAAPLCAGLFFSGPSGIIAGIIGGIYRYFFGNGDFTRTACSIAVVSCGVIAAVLRKGLFDGKKPSYAYGFGIGMVCEVLHMLLIMTTNMDNLTEAFVYIRQCTLPMVLCVAAALMISTWILEMLSGKKKEKSPHTKELTHSFQTWLLLCVLAAFTITCVFSHMVQSRMALKDAETVLSLNIEDMILEAERKNESREEIARSAPYVRVGKEGGILICDSELTLLSGGHRGSKLKDTQIFDQSVEGTSDTCFQISVYGTPSYCMFTKYNNLYYIAYIPVTEVMYYRSISGYLTFFTQMLIFAALFCLIYLLTKRLIVDNIRKINGTLSKIAAGNLEEQVDVKDYKEFASLSDDINITVAALRHYIAEAAARIDRELEFARTIQHSALPSVFPPYPERKEFDIFASMDTAKEVGGDFYDFYFVGPTKICFLIADVSGKGISAAMFMMMAKTVIKGLAETSMSVEQVFMNANNKLCENNDAGMFVTAWMGVLDYTTGEVSFTNAGHNPPLILRKNGTCEYLKMKPGFVLAGMEDIPYTKGTLKLEPGDAVFLYTDGITEAMNKKEELYGEEALKRAAEQSVSYDVTEICRQIKENVNVFVGDAPQFDDMTMLAIRWNGNANHSSDDQSK